MGKKKTTGPAAQAVTPAYVTVAERLAREVCDRLNTTPKQAAKNLNTALAKHGGHTGGLRPVNAHDLFSDPWAIIQSAGSDLAIIEERLAAALWVGTQAAKALARQPNGNAAALGDLSWRLSRIADAVRFPELRDRILNEGRKKSLKTRQKYADAWHQIAEAVATDYLQQHPRDKLIAAVSVCRQKIIVHLGRAPTSSTIEQHLKSKKIFSLSRK